MNIRQAKDAVKDTVRLYLKKNDLGEYCVETVRQRPIYLLGAPGIGKTAIMEQVAQEMGIALVFYSMTHHTRQSALGLPFITQKTYDGKEVQVSEYTMSEIIATVYETMEESGIREGILFLDEINCVSETLFPSMLQFLQYKVFGRHRVPEGWVIVTAGNPPEYNRMVREFDVVTMDRMKLMEIEPDLAAWRAYAGERQLHGAVLGYLEVKREHFYVMETTARGRSYVTARGWEDLSRMLLLYESEGLAVDESLIGQYLHHDTVAKEFAVYYELYQKYKREYQIARLLDGSMTGEERDAALRRAREARFDERVSLLSMLSDRIEADMGTVMEEAEVLSGVAPVLRQIKARAGQASGDGQALSDGQASGDGQALGDGQVGPTGVVGTDAGAPGRKDGAIDVPWVVDALGDAARARERQLRSQQRAGSLSDARRRQYRLEIRFLEEAQGEVLTSEAADAAAAAARATAAYGTRLAALQESAARVQGELRTLLSFAEEAYAEGNELLILLSRLTASGQASRFLAAFGSEDYRRLSSRMMVTERGARLKEEIIKLELW